MSWYQHSRICGNVSNSNIHQCTIRSEEILKIIPISFVRYLNDGSVEGMKKLWEVFYKFFTLNRGWNITMETELMTEIGLAYDDSGVNGPRFSQKSCVAQLFPAARAATLKQVMKKGPHHNKCLQEEGSGLKDMGTWDERFIRSWHEKGTSKRSIAQKKAKQKPFVCEAVPEIKVRRFGKKLVRLMVSRKTTSRSWR